MGTGYERPGRGHYVNATRAIQHGDITAVANMVGSAIKQQAYDSDAAKSTRQTIANGERFFLRVKGIAEAETGAGKQGAAIAASAVGTPVWIDTTDDSLELAAGANRRKLGVIVAVPGVHGCPPGIARIDMDMKDSIDDVA
jgi:hypothetical protein